MQIYKYYSIFMRSIIRVKNRYFDIMNWFLYNLLYKIFVIKVNKYLNHFLYLRTKARSHSAITTCCLTMHSKESELPVLYDSVKQIKLKVMFRLKDGYLKFIIILKSSKYFRKASSKRPCNYIWFLIFSADGQALDDALYNVCQVKHNRR